MKITEDMIGFDLTLTVSGPDGSSWGYGVHSYKLRECDRSYSEKTMSVELIDNKVAQAIAALPRMVRELKEYIAHLERDNHVRDMVGNPMAYGRDKEVDAMIANKRALLAEIGEDK